MAKNALISDIKRRIKLKISAPPIHLDPTPFQLYALTASVNSK
jgi:hypothetical protein